MNETKLDSVRSPMGGCISVRHGTATSALAHIFQVDPRTAVSRLKRKPQPAVLEGLKVEVFYAAGEHALAYEILEASRPARDHILSLRSTQWQAQWIFDIERAALEELQALTRAIAAKTEAFNVLEELGIGRG